MKKSPFDILGISPGSSEREIKSAFKKLASQCHPDKAKNEQERIEFEEKFKDANTAYQQLMKDDEPFSIPFPPFDFFSDIFGSRRERIDDYQFNITLNMQEFLNGSSHLFTVVEHYKCDQCNGDPYKDKSMCPVCSGHGFIKHNFGTGILINRLCHECSGRGFIFKSKCEHCNDGKKQKQKTYKINISVAEELK